MRPLKIILMVTVFGLLFCIAPGFQDGSLFNGVRLAHAAMTDKVKKAWLDDIAETIGCHCGCDMTLKDCEQDDPDCQLRPVLIQKLPAVLESEGPSLLEVGGCTCGCGYKVTECEEKHKDWTQRPRIHQKLKRLAIKYGYEKIFLQNSKLAISSAERKMFIAAQKGRTSLLYVHEERHIAKSKYMKTLKKFQQQCRNRLALIPVYLAEAEEKIPLAVLTAVVFSVLSGIAPSWRASKMNPGEILQEI